MDDDLRDRWLEHASARMTAAGLRSGAARTAVTELLAREGHCLLSATEITARLRDHDAGSAASVYRVLEELSDLGLVHRLDGRDGVARYEIADPDRHHHHFVDDHTGAVQPFTDAQLEQAIHAVAGRLGIQLASHDVILRGTRPTTAGPDAGDPEPRGPVETTVPAGRGSQ